MLLTKEVEVVLNGRNIKRLESLGYHIPRRKSKWGDFSTPEGTTIVVNVGDLTTQSNQRIVYSCDICLQEYSTSYATYNSQQKNQGRDICQKCYTANIIIPNISKRNFDTGILESIESYCLRNDRMDVLSRWDYDKNEFSPSEISIKSNKKIFLFCENGKHDSEEKTFAFLVNGGSENVLNCKKCNSFGECNVDMLFLWGDSNELSPYDVDRVSGKRVFWKCPEGKHEEFERSVANSIGAKFRCPKCSEERSESFLQEKVRNYLSEKFTVLTEHCCNIRAKNPKTGYYLPYDNEIVELNLIIETQGTQHYMETALTRKAALKQNISVEEVLEYQQWKDQYKKDYAISQGYHFLEIPYWTDDSNETWKQLIDDKIDQILSNQYQ